MIRHVYPLVNEFSTAEGRQKPGGTCPFSVQGIELLAMKYTTPHSSDRSPSCGVTSYQSWKTLSWGIQKRKQLSLKNRTFCVTWKNSDAIIRSS